MWKEGGFVDGHSRMPLDRAMGFFRFETLTTIAMVAGGEGIKQQLSQLCDLMMHSHIGKSPVRDLWEFVYVVYLESHSRSRSSFPCQQRAVGPACQALQSLI